MGEAKSGDEGFAGSAYKAPSVRPPHALNNSRHPAGLDFSLN